jgi:hypothetical protein
MDTINSRNVDRVTLVSREPNTQEKIGKMDTELSFDKFFQNADNLQGVEEIGKYLQKLDSTFSELSVENIKLIDGLF